MNVNSSLQEATLNVPVAEEYYCGFPKFRKSPVPVFRVQDASKAKEPFQVRSRHWLEQEGLNVFVKATGLLSCKILRIYGYTVLHSLVLLPRVKKGVRGVSFEDLGNLLQSLLTHFKGVKKLRRKSANKSNKDNLSTTKGIIFSGRTVAQAFSSIFRKYLKVTYSPITSTMQNSLLSGQKETCSDWKNQDSDKNSFFEPNFKIFSKFISLISVGFRTHRTFNQIEL